MRLCWIRFFLLMPLIFPTVFFSGNFGSVKAESLPLASFLWNHQDPMRVGWNGEQLFVQLKAHPGEGEYRLAFRVLREGHSHFRVIQGFLADSRLDNNQYLTLPFSNLNGPIQATALRALFPRDSPDARGWKHQVTYDWESLESLVNAFVEEEFWQQSLNEFEGQGFVQQSPRQEDVVLNTSVRNRILERGFQVIIPWKWIRQDLNLKPVALKPPLDVHQDQRGGRFAVYRLDAGETIYSNVVLRFTNFSGQKRIEQAVGDLLVLNELVNVHDIPSGTIIRIPLHWIRNDFQFLTPGVYQEPVIENLRNSPKIRSCKEMSSCIPVESEIPGPLQQSDRHPLPEDRILFPNLISGLQVSDPSWR